MTTKGAPPINTSTYPIKIKASANVIGFWQNSEQGSYENLDGANTETPHVFEILTRHRTVIEIRNDAEALTVLESADYQGEGGIWDEDHPTHRAIDEIANKILGHDMAR